MDCFTRYFHKCEEQNDFIFELVCDIVDGSKKVNVTNWWLGYIEEKTNDVCRNFSNFSCLFLLLMIPFFTNVNYNFDIFLPVFKIS